MTSEERIAIKVLADKVENLLIAIGMGWETDVIIKEVGIALRDVQIVIDNNEAR